MEEERGWTWVLKNGQIKRGRRGSVTNDVP